VSKVALHRACLHHPARPQGHEPRPRARVPALVAILLLLAGQCGNADSMVGWAEYVRVYPGAIVVRAKIDTGADISSLHCHCAEPFKREGQDWIRITLTNEMGEQFDIERRIERLATIRRQQGGKERRYVIKLGICLAGVYKDAEVNLVDRTGLDYPMLIGREFLAGSFRVDPSVTFSSRPQCDIAAP
jgi:hypothetical protein